MTGISDEIGVSSPTALVYEITEEARLVLREASDGELAEARADAAEAAYYLSDSIGPEDRVSLLGLAERRQLQGGGVQREGDRASDALVLLGDAAGEVEHLLRGPEASSELRIALRALRRAIGRLANCLGLEPGHLTAGTLRAKRLAVFRAPHAKG
jgi:hypothetical protein